MALTTCEECGETFATHFPSCPFCGDGTTKTTNSHSKTKGARGSSKSKKRALSKEDREPKSGFATALSATFAIALSAGLFYLGGWSVEHLDHVPLFVSLTDGYLGVETNSGDWWGITPSDRFFKFCWASWACLMLSVSAITGGGFFFFAFW